MGLKYQMSYRNFFWTALKPNEFYSRYVLMCSKSHSYLNVAGPYGPCPHVLYLPFVCRKALAKG